MLKRKKTLCVSIVKHVFNTMLAVSLLCFLIGLILFVYSLFIDLGSYSNNIRNNQVNDIDLFSEDDQLWSTYINYGRRAVRNPETNITMNSEPNTTEISSSDTSPFLSIFIKRLIEFTIVKGCQDHPVSNDNATLLTESDENVINDCRNALRLAGLFIKYYYTQSITGKEWTEFYETLQNDSAKIPKITLKIIT